MKQIRLFILNLCLTISTLFLCGCSQILDLTAGDWYGSEEMYVLDAEGDPVRFVVNMHLLLGDNWNYIMEFTFSGTIQHEETQDYKDLSFTGEWSRTKYRFEFTNYGEANMLHFTDKQIVLESKWPFKGRNVSELSLNQEERKEASKKLPTITINKRE